MPVVTFNKSNCLGLQLGNNSTDYSINGFNRLDNFYLAQDYNSKAVDSSVGTLMKRPYNDGQTDVHEITFDGTVTFNQNSTAVTGVGTAFEDDVFVGECIRKNNTSPFYMVKTVTDDNNIILSTDYLEATGAGALDSSLRCPRCVGAQEFTYNEGANMDIPMVYAAFAVGSAAGRLAYMKRTGTTWSQVTMESITGGADIYHPVYGVIDDAGITVFFCYGGLAWGSDNSNIFKASANYPTISTKIRDKGKTGTALSGTLSFIEGSGAVTGDVNTLFLTELRAGDWIQKADGDGIWGEVDFITNNASLSLSYPYLGTTGDGGAGTSYKANTAGVNSRFIESFQGRMFLAYIEYISVPHTHPVRVQWSVPSDFEDWSGTGSGYIDVPGEGGSITGMAALGEYLFIFRKTAYHVYRGTGEVESPLEQVNKVFYGCEDQGSIIKRGDFIVYRTPEGEFRMTNGSSDISISSNGLGLYPTSYDNIYRTPYNAGWTVKAAYDNNLKIYKYFPFTYGEPPANSLNYFLDKKEWTKDAYVAELRIANGVAALNPVMPFTSTAIVPSLYANTPRVTNVSFINSINQVRHFDTRYPDITSCIGDLKTGYIHNEDPSKKITVKKIYIEFVPSNYGGTMTDTTISIELLGKNFDETTAITSSIWSDEYQLTDTVGTAGNIIAKTFKPNQTASYAALRVYDDGTKANYYINSMTVEYGLLKTT